MPTDPGYIHTEIPHPSTVDDGKPYGCHNKLRPAGPFIACFQDGWTDDGRRLMVERPVQFAERGCMHAGLSGLNRHNDPKCAGCRWSGDDKGDA